ncbi:MAG TPA: GNAT family N-acetyltransferase [Thermoleophilaceae bacterium]
MTATVRLITDEHELEPYVEAWDALAAAARRPMAAPGWLLPWWRHAAPAGAVLRTVVVEDAAGLVGVAPFFGQPGRLGRWDYRLIGVPVSQRVGPVAAAGREQELMAAVAATLSRARPSPTLISFEAVDEESRWPELLAESYPGLLPPRIARGTVQACPMVTLQQKDFGLWLEDRSSNFRQQLRRARRQLATAGGRTRLADAESLERDVDSLLRLHHSRWDWRGGSALPERTRELLLDSAAMLGAGERLRLWIVEVGDEAIGAGLFVAGGGEIVYVNGGFDETHARLRPAVLAIAAAVEEGFERGEQRLDLGSGASPYKLRFADAEPSLRWLALRIRGARYPVTWAQLLPGDLRWYTRRTVNRLPEGPRERLKSAVRALRR